MNEGVVLVVLAYLVGTAIGLYVAPAVRPLFWRDEKVKPITDPTFLR